MKDVLDVRVEKPRMNISTTKVRVKLVKTLATSVSGAPTLYDDGTLYDAVYYDKWVGGSDQGETPHLNIDSKNAKIDIKERKPNFIIKNGD